MARRQRLAHRQRLGVVSSLALALLVDRKRSLQRLVHRRLADRQQLARRQRLAHRQRLGLSSRVAKDPWPAATRGVAPKGGLALSGYYLDVDFSYVMFVTGACLLLLLLPMPLLPSLLPQPSPPRWPVRRFLAGRCGHTHVSLCTSTATTGTTS